MDAVDIKDRPLRYIFSAAGFIVATSALLSNKLHFVTLQRLSNRLMSNAVMRGLLQRHPLSWYLLGLMGFSATLAGLNTGAIGPAAAITLLLAALVWLDLGLAEVTRYPDSVAEILGRCQRTWVHRLTPALRDAKQIVLIRHIVDLLVVCCALLGCFICCAALEQPAWLLLLPAHLVYIRANGLWQEIVHIDSHTRFMRPRREPATSRHHVLRVLQWLFDWVLSQYFGMFPYWYMTEHIGLHHPEVNSPRDVETLCWYDRTNFMHFAEFSSRVTLHTLSGYGMYGYLLATGRRRYAVIALLGAIAHAITILACFQISAPLGTWLALSSLGFGYSLSIIAISDHGLADPDEPGDVFRNSFNMQWTLDDHGQYGGRYHLTHHLNPAPTWGDRTTALAQHHNATVAADNDSILLHGLAYPDDLLRAFWSADPDFLYRYVISVGGQRPTLSAWRSIFATRVRPRAARQPSAAIHRLSALMAQLATWHIPPPDAPVSGAGTPLSNGSPVAHREA
jgi:hypothetical protein